MDRIVIHAARKTTSSFDCPSVSAFETKHRMVMPAPSPHQRRHGKRHRRAGAEGSASPITAPPPARPAPRAPASGDKAPAQAARMRKRGRHGPAGRAENERTLAIARPISGTAPGLPPAGARPRAPAGARYARPAACLAAARTWPAAQAGGGGFWRGRRKAKLGQARGKVGRVERALKHRLIFRPARGGRIKAAHRERIAHRILGPARQHAFFARARRIAIGAMRQQENRRRGKAQRLTHLGLLGRQSPPNAAETGAHRPAPQSARRRPPGSAAQARSADRVRARFQRKA